ncbi:hypothetical protein CJF30_00002402 [Rutstroemia sp. NJR-2017a BBW]|nr:hypothetical protein CJF30_00002402 [Rutstroemia sp. NJR-2017a BBW]
MTEASESADQGSEDLLDRETLCLPDFTEDSILHSGDDGFRNILEQYFPTAESNASERLVNLKSRLRKASTHDFWAILLEEMCNITGAQCGLVAKRMLVDDQDSAIEMPELGEEGSCLMGVAFYMKHDEFEELKRDYRYTAFGTPCAYMKYDKVFIVPERLSEVTANNPNVMPWGPSEAFIGVPLMLEGKCFAHFALIWSADGARKKQLGWTYIEMFMHSLEDMILERIVQGQSFAKEEVSSELTAAKIIPLAAITASQSLKPYARSLSHELRTPMQGVIGMLDIMYSTVVEAMTEQQNDRVRSVFNDLKANIEIVQDSSKRAVEAADNVVHAYDLNMQMPDAPLTPEDNDGKKSFSCSIREPSVPVETRQQTLHLSSSTSPRKRCRPDDLDFCQGPPLRRKFSVAEQDCEPPRCSMDSTVLSANFSDPSVNELSPFARMASGIQMMAEAITYNSKPSPIISPASIGSANQRLVTREFMRNLVSDALKTDRAMSEHRTVTEHGEMIEIKTQGSRGESRYRTIHLVIEPDVPEAILTEEQHLHFSISKVIDNAIKFTDGGSITITVKLNKKLQMVEIWVVDTGCGITEESRLRLFQPHFQENATIKRPKDGLGLSLFNAKAHVRKNFGGDVTLERSATEGPAKGSEFLIRLPIFATDLIGAATPLIGATPNLAPISQVTLPSASSSVSPFPGSPSKLGRRQIHNSNLAKEYPLNFLVAEDNAINRRFIFTALTKLGYTADNITLAFDGAEAVRCYKESLLKPVESHFNIILMDIWMPTMDGYEATKEILNLARECEQSATIIAVTADITDDCSTRSREAGMRGFLAKPYKVFDIEKVIIEHFGRV